MTGMVVSGSTGSAVRGALVIAEEISNGTKHTKKTGDRGNFWFDSLPGDCIYEVRIKKKRFTVGSMTIFLSRDKDISEVALGSKGAVFTRTSRRTRWRVRQM